MRFLRFVLTACVLISGALTVLYHVVPHIAVRRRFDVKKSAAIGIIGSADGPTAVYVSSINPRVLESAPRIFALSLVLRQLCRKNG